MSMDRYSFHQRREALDTKGLDSRRIPPAHIPALETLRQAAVPAATLMADPSWSLYQQMLQASIERTERNRDRFIARLNSADCASAEEMFRLKQLIAECNAMVTAWTAAIALPKQLIENARMAEESISKVVEPYESR